ncbi:hypothetical protein P3342_009086 [Pyrenophora teres f. teres]|nr:hypothetical protein P3342_009086 [Pyrenophora teres f. teres]
MLAKTAFLASTLLLPHASTTTPYPLPNSTYPSNSTLCTLDPTPCQATPAAPTREYICHHVFPTDLTVVNSRYPNYTTDHLHRSHDFFMLRRQRKDQGEIATQVQFNGLPNTTSGLTCRLEFVLPNPQLQRISGPNPSFNVYRVEREARALATWETYEKDAGALFFGAVNGEREALERTRRVGGGVAAVNSTACNATMAFTMAMMYDSEEPNYWQFTNVAPPAFPVQGFRVVYGC